MDAKRHKSLVCYIYKWIFVYQLGPSRFGNINIKMPFYENELVEFGMTNDYETHYIIKMEKRLEINQSL